MKKLNKSELERLRKEKYPEVKEENFISFLKNKHKVTVLNRQNSKSKSYCVCEDAL